MASFWNARRRASHGAFTRELMAEARDCIAWTSDTGKFNDRVVSSQRRKEPLSTHLQIQYRRESDGSVRLFCRPLRAFALSLAKEFLTRAVIRQTDIVLDATGRGGAGGQLRGGDSIGGESHPPVRAVDVIASLFLRSDLPRRKCG